MLKRYLVLSVVTAAFSLPSLVYAAQQNILSVHILWICPYISRHLLSLNPLQARCRRYSRGER